MYLKVLRQRKPNGRIYTYYRLVESYREAGKVKHRVLVELGALSPGEVEYLARRFARLAGMELGSDLEELEVSGWRYFGGPVLVERLLELVGLGRWVQEAAGRRRVSFSVSDALKVMLCAHLFKSGSRAELAVWDWQQKLCWYEHGVKDLSYQHLLRSLAVLRDMREEIEEKLFLSLRDLFDVKLDAVFYDLTSTYVEGRGDWSDLLERGYSRDKRGDCKQVVIGVVVTGEGFPITYRVFEGNRVDSKTLEEMVKELRGRFSIDRCIWVSDAGLLTERNERVLREGGYEYILGMGGMEKRKEFREALGKLGEARAGEFGEVRFWEVGCAGREGVRMVVVESEGRREKTVSILERRLERVRRGLARLEGQVRSGRCRDGEEIRLRAEKVLHGSRVRKYFRYEVRGGRFRWWEDGDAVERRKAEAGKYGLLTNASLSGEAVVGAYRTLLKVEELFLVLKDVLELRPLWHKCDENVEGHVQLALWSFVLYKMLERLLKRKGVDLATERVLEAVKEVRAVEVSLPERRAWKLMKVPVAAQRAFEAVGIRDLKGRFQRWAKQAPPYRYQPRVIRKDRRATRPAPSLS